MNSDYIEASFDTLLEQAPKAADAYLRRAKDSIDSLFGDGYAAKNPALVAAFIQAATTDMAAATHGKVMGTALRAIAQQLGAIASALPRD